MDLLRDMRARARELESDLGRFDGKDKGHAKEIEQRRRGLREKLDTWDRNGCGQKTGQNVDDIRVRVRATKRFLKLTFRSIRCASFVFVGCPNGHSQRLLNAQANESGSWVQNAAQYLGIAVTTILWILAMRLGLRPALVGVAGRVA